MSYPHDYYEYGPHHHEHPHLHNRGEDRPYLDQDWHANHHDAELPILSAIGRGPRGEGLYVGNEVNSEGNVSFALYSSLTGEKVWQSPNLSPARFSFNAPGKENLVPGVKAPLDITVKQGGVTKTTRAYLPPGERGSLVYLLGDTVQKEADNTYQTTIDKLTIYGKSYYQNKPLPKPNDIVFMRYIDGKWSGFAFGVIEYSGGIVRETESGTEPTDNIVVFTANIYIPTNGVPFGYDSVDGRWEATEDIAMWDRISDKPEWIDDQGNIDWDEITNIPVTTNRLYSLLNDQDWVDRFGSLVPPEVTAIAVRSMSCLNAIVRASIEFDVRAGAVIDDLILPREALSHILPDPVGYHIPMAVWTTRKNIYARGQMLGTSASQNPEDPLLHVDIDTSQDSYSGSVGIYFSQVYFIDK